MRILGVETCSAELMFEVVNAVNITPMAALGGASPYFAEFLKEPVLAMAAPEETQAPVADVVKMRAAVRSAL